MTSRFILGIHFGFTHSEVSINISNKPEIVRDKFNDEVIPNLVSFRKRDEKHMIGHGNFAQKIRIRCPQNAIYDITFMLGRQYDDQLIQEKSKEWPFKIEKTETGGILVCIDDKKYEPYEIAGEFLKYLAEIGNQYFPVEERTNKVVICIPNDLNEQNITSDIIRAADYANLKVINIITEPIAAAFAYQLNHRENDLFFILLNFDDHHFEISLLNKCKERIVLVDVENDYLLGGKQFIDNTVQALIKEFKLNDIFQNNPKKMLRFRDNIIDAIIQLNSTNLASFFIDDDDIEFKITLEHFEEINKNLIDKVANLITKFSRLERIDMTILAGKFAHFQFVESKIREITGKESFRGISFERIFAIGTSIFIKENFVED